MTSDSAQVTGRQDASDRSAWTLMSRGLLGLLVVLSGRGLAPAEEDTCDATGGCDPEGIQEQLCLAENGEWDPNTCTCNAPTECNDAGQPACEADGNIWDHESCECKPCAATEVPNGPPWTEDTGESCEYNP